MVALIIGVACGNEHEHRAVESPLLVGGMSLVERAVLAAHRAGVDQSVVVGSAHPDDAMTGRLRGRGADVTFIDWGALQQLDLSDGALVIRACVLVEPRALVALLDYFRSGDLHTVL